MYIKYNILKYYSEIQLIDISKICNIYPNLEVKFTLQKSKIYCGIKINNIIGSLCLPKIISRFI